MSNHPRPGNSSQQAGRRTRPGTLSKQQGRSSTAVLREAAGLTDSPASSRGLTRHPAKGSLGPGAGGAGSQGSGVTVCSQGPEGRWGHCPPGRH